MCLAFIALDQHPEYPLIIASNRDEFYARPSEAMHWWQPENLLAGKDQQAGGTWLALNKQANFAMVTNYREQPTVVGETSRGSLAIDFLSSQQTAEHFIATLKPERYSGFNLVLGNLVEKKLFHFSNRKPVLTAIEPGYHGLSNALLNTPWPKVESGKAMMKTLCQQRFNQTDWFNLLADRQLAVESLLPSTGLDIDTERMLSSRFIQSDDYGTRCSTVITVDHKGVIQITERNFNSKGQKKSQNSFTI